MLPPERYQCVRLPGYVYGSAASGQVAVQDPYCWLEKRTDEVEKRVTAQGLFVRSYLDQNPDRQKLEDSCDTSVPV